MLEMLAIDEQWYTDHIRQAHIMRGPKLSAELMQAINSPEAVAKLMPVRRGTGSVAVIPVVGFLTQKPTPTLLSILFGGTSVEAVVAEIVTALRDTSVSAVVLDVDSPGGSVHGLIEAAAKIRSVRGGKPIFAVADPFAASAAYWLASQADVVVSTPSSITGSIGVIVAHTDISAALERDGINVTVVRYGAKKAIDNEMEPLTDDALAGLQAMVDYFGRAFDADVAKGRRVSVDRVRTDFGQGAVFTAENAVRAGLADRVGMLEEVVRQAAKGRRPESMGPPPRAYDRRIGDLVALRAGLRYHKQDENT